MDVSVKNPNDVACDICGALIVQRPFGSWACNSCGNTWADEDIQPILKRQIAQREEEIRLKKEEILLIKQLDPITEAAGRILAILEARLADLQRGMRE